MAEANPSIQQTLTAAHARITTAAHVLAMLRSRNAVKEELRKQGLKVSHFAAREITSWAQVYLDDHHETLIPDAIEEARAMILRGDLGKRAQRPLCANLSSDAQKEKAQKSITSAVQMLGAERQRLAMPVFQRTVRRSTLNKPHCARLALRQCLARR